MGSENYQRFLTGFTVLQGVQQPTLALTWLSTKPLWVNQWPLTGEKLIALQTLLQGTISCRSY